MKTHGTTAALTLSLLAAGGLGGYGAERTVKVGSPAPKLQVAKWAQGEPVKDLQSGQAYIVEFWATWCGPCVASIPHVNEIHAKYKDKGLVVIGQNVWERDETKVAPFIKEMGEKMTYRVALDDKSSIEKGAMAETWMTAAGQNGIPAAFLVNKQGKIAWIGHPMGLKDSLVEEVLNGTHDINQAAAAYEAKLASEEKMEALWGDFQTHARAKKWDEALTALDAVEKAAPEEDRPRLGLTRFRVLLMKKDYEGGYKLAEELSRKHAEDGMMQNELAWQILTMEGVEKRDLNLAEKIALQANKATQGENAEILDTLARAQFMKGQKSEAVATQQKAVGLATGARKKQFQQTLDSYKEGKTPEDY